MGVLTKKSRGFLLFVCIYMTFFLGFQCGGFQLAMLKIAQEFDVPGAAVGSFVTAQFSAIIVFMPKRCPT